MEKQHFVEDNKPQKKLFGNNIIQGSFLVIVASIIFFVAYYLWQINQNTISQYETRLVILQSHLEQEKENVKKLTERSQKQEQIIKSEKYPALNATACNGGVGGGCVVADEMSFTFENLPGSIKYICELESYFDEVCVGNGYMQVTYKDQTEIIERYTWADREDMLFEPYAVFFSEGSFSHSTTSNRENARLLLGLSMLNCHNADGACFFNYKISHEISLPNLEVRPLFGVGGTLVSPDSFSWNESGNKAVQLIACPAGCTALMYSGINLDTLKETPLIWHRDDEFTTDVVESPVEDASFYGIDTIEWLDDSTVKIGDHEFSL